MNKNSCPQTNSPTTGAGRAMTSAPVTMPSNISGFCSRQRVKSLRIGSSGVPCAATRIRERQSSPSGCYSRSDWSSRRARPDEAHDSLLYEVQPTDPTIFTSVAILVPLVALTAATSRPAAARVHPAVSVRYESRRNARATWLTTTLHLPTLRTLEA